MLGMDVLIKHAGRWLQFASPKRILRAETPEQVVPMLLEAEASGLYAAGFVAYEAASAFDDALQTQPAEKFPLLCLGLFDAPDVLEQIVEPADGAYELGPLKASVSKPEFVAAIDAIKQRIAEGATYQVNYTYRLQGGFSGDARTFFHRLVHGQRAEYAAYIDIGDYAICSASPELFFSLHDGRLVSRPMKGTAPRGRTFSEDWKQSEALQASEKDRAENIMIVDMIRNDIGRVAEPGSVAVPSCFDVEKYPTVWQMTSTVGGRTNEGVTAVFSALFPCASITGAPKAKTMEIITALETSPRRIYTGAMGFITPGGEACFNVAIRTALIDRQAGQLEYGVGGGIVWDSDAEAEYEETLTKARVLTADRPDFKLLETMLWEPESGLFLQNEHIQRLGKSAAYFDVPIDMYALSQALAETLEALEPVPHKIRLLVDRSGDSELQTFPLSNDAERGSIKVALASQPVDVSEVFLYHKTTHRTVYEEAKAAFPDCDDVILWNERGEVTESCFANVVIQRDGERVTPPVQSGLLAGTFRADLLKRGEIREAVITLEDLRAAEEIWIVNSVRKWQRVELEA